LLVYSNVKHWKAKSKQCDTYHKRYPSTSCQDKIAKFRRQIILFVSILAELGPQENKLPWFIIPCKRWYYTTNTCITWFEDKQLILSSQGLEVDKVVPKVKPYNNNTWIDVMHRRHLRGVLVVTFGYFSMASLNTQKVLLETMAASKSVV
jgi:hypothetical protein